MNKNYAYRILDIDPNLKNISLQMLKKKYYLMALKYHPDKNTSQYAAEHFQEIKNAYDFLCLSNEEYSDTDDSEDEYSDLKKNDIASSSQYVFLLLKHVLKRKEIVQIIQKFSEGCITRAFELFAAMNISHMIYLYDTLKKYETNIHFFFDKNILLRMEELIKEKTAKSQIIILNPSIDNLLDCLLYKGCYGDESTFLVPLWHHDLTYELKNPCRELIVKCIPELQDGITIDEYNNIHVYLSLTIDDVFDKKKINFSIGEKVFSISCDILRFYSCQRVVLHGVGIPRINHDDIFDISNLSDIIVCVEILRPLRDKSAVL